VRELLGVVCAIDSGAQYDRSAKGREDLTPFRHHQCAVSWFPSLPAVFEQDRQFSESFKTHNRLPPHTSRSLAALPCRSLVWALALLNREVFHIYGLICVLHFGLYMLSPLVLLPKVSIWYCATLAHVSQFGIRRLLEWAIGRKQGHTHARTAVSSCSIRSATSGLYRPWLFS
jgi:hypothetical protein